MNIKDTKLDILEVDDFLDQLEEETSTLNKEFATKLKKAKEIYSELTGYFKSIGFIPNIKNRLTSNNITLGLFNCKKSDLKIGKLEKTLLVVNYNSDGPIRINVNTEEVFTNHILITTDEKTYKKLCKSVHNNTIIILSDGKVIKNSKVYSKCKKITPKNCLTISPKNVLNINIKGKEMNYDTYLHMMSNMYKEFCARINLNEYGSTWTQLSPTTDRLRDSVGNQAFQYLPFNAIQKPVVTSTREFTKGRSKHKANSIIYATNILTKNEDSAIENTFVYKSELPTYERYLKRRNNVFKIDTDIILPNTLPILLNTVIFSLPKKTISTSMINRLYKIAYENDRYYFDNRNRDINDMTQIQKSFYTKINHVNNEYNLDLKHHQLHGILNVIPNKAVMLKADVGLGKTRMAIATCIARGGKHNLIVTEPGNVNEVVREFQTQLKQEAPNVIKTENDICNLKQFNVTAYSTIAKILKESNLNNLEEPVLSPRMISLATGSIHGSEVDTIHNLSSNYANRYTNGFPRGITNGFLRINVDGKKNEKNPLYKILNATRNLQELLSGYDTDGVIMLDDVTNTRYQSKISNIHKEITEMRKNKDVPVIDQLMSHLDQYIDNANLDDNAYIEERVSGRSNESTLDSTVEYLIQNNNPTHNKSIQISTHALNSFVLKVFDILIANADSQLSIEDLISEYYQYYERKPEIIDQISKFLKSIEASNHEREDDFRRNYFICSDKVEITIDNNSQPLLIPYKPKTVKYKIKKSDYTLNNKPIESLTKISLNNKNTDLLISCKLLNFIDTLIIEEFKRETKLRLEELIDRIDEIKSTQDRRENNVAPKSVNNLIRHLSLTGICRDTSRSILEALNLYLICLPRFKKDIKNMQQRSRFRNKMLANLLSNKFNTVVFDECHSLKNATASRSIAAAKIKAKNYIFMSATPIGNKLSEMLSYLIIGFGPRSTRHLVDIQSRYFDKYKKMQTSNRKYLTMELDHTQNNFSIDITSNIGDIDKAGFPEDRIFSMINRNIVKVLRSNEGIVKDKQWKFDLKEYKIFSVPSEEHMLLYSTQMELVYNALREGHYENSKEALSVLTNLIKISEVPHLISEDFVNKLTQKQNDIVKLASRELGKERSVIIFTQFKDTVEIIAKALSREVENNVYMLHKNLSPSKRFEIIDAFRNDKKHACIVGTVSNLGKGFNLGNADVIIMSDVPWQPLLYDQSVGRILRPDQKGHPEVYISMNKYMIDMYKFDSIRAKLNMIKKYIDSDNSISKDETQKMDYKQFLVDLLNKAIEDGALTLAGPDSSEGISTGGI